MHRMPLLIPTPSILWDRNLPEWVLFERTLNKPNVEETNAFLTILDSEADFYNSSSYRMGEDMFSTAQRYLKDNNPAALAEAMFYINYIIIRTPKECPVLPSALKIRGNFSYHDCFFEQASKDYEMYLEVYKVTKTPNEDVCEVYGHLVVCMYMMRKLVKAKKYFRSYKKYKAKLSPDILKKSTFVKIENYIKQFVNEIDDVEKAPKFLEIQCKGIPYKGFTSQPEIAAASTMCYYNNGIYVKDDIPRASILFVEDPIMQSLNIPILDCEVCYKQSQNQIYSCLECRYKTYCSLLCLERDKAAHRDECIGYKQLTILVLDASSNFRIFVRISNLLYEHIFNPQMFRKLRSAEEVWNKMLELIKTLEIPGNIDLDLLRMKPGYFDLSEMQYSTLVATSFRLTLFIEKKTDLIDKYYKRLHISNKQKLILIGSILMRIHCNILLNSFDFEITKTVNNEKSRNTLPLNLSIKEIEEMVKTINRRQCSIMDVDKFYDIDFDKDVRQRAEQIINSKKDSKEMGVSHLTVLRHVKPCKRIHRILSTYKDNIAELYFQSELMHTIIYGDAASQPTSSASAKILCGRIADMSDIDRYMFVKRFARLFHIHYAEYFLQMFNRDEEIQQVLTLYCPTLRKFKHSCEPNVEVLVLDNGVVIGKTLRKIKKGEQLYVSFKAHYMHHAKVERRQFLKRNNINCKCEYCKKDDYDDPINLRLTIFCDRCKVIQITPNQGVCPSCKNLFNNLFNKYRTVVYILENELKFELSPCESTERDIYILHLILFSYAKQYFVPQNEVRIAIELRMAYFLAIQNFAKESYKLVKEIQDNILTTYDEQLVWFTFYAEILLIIKIILWNNLEDKLVSLSNSELNDLCTFGLHIANGQKDYIDFYEIFDSECSSVLDDIKVLLKWKEKIACTEYLPLAKFLSMPEPQIH
ncbi:uncharacterized protein LOC119611174 [Lucilia sericata]|uniref:uncharacterized protein LOC119611174 n=1 Tax=Lucilia sericata TaxID=13632 RepID=UPI0018A87F9C|nr:uncharacterized protein LOC119611174 [Lucilia sericata]